MKVWSILSIKIFFFTTINCFIYHAPLEPTEKEPLGTVFKDIECQWVGYTTWYGYCHVHSCPEDKINQYYEEMKSDGWSYIKGTILIEIL